MENKSIAVYVATHKKISAKLPYPYIPVQVNCVNTGEHWEGYEHDDHGDNISMKNPSYCELTVLYWAWKNSKAKIKGLSHYRRFMSKRSDVSFIAKEYCDLENLDDYILSQQEINRYLNQEGYDILLIMPHRPYPLTGRETIENFVFPKDVNCMERIIHENYLTYVDSLNITMRSNHLSQFNMMITHSKHFDAYCEWVFDILQKVEELTDISKYDNQHKRLYGYLAEILQNVYVEKNNLKCKYFVLTQPYQILGIKEETFYKTQKKEELFKFLKKIHIPYIESIYYKLFHPKIYQKKIECEQYIMYKNS